jgi:hypothetical protein
MPLNSAPRRLTYRIIGRYQKTKMAARNRKCYNFGLAQVIDVIPTATPTVLMSDWMPHWTTNCDADCLPGTKMVEAKLEVRAGYENEPDAGRCRYMRIQSGDIKIWEEPLESRRYLVPNQIYNYFRFSNGHLSFLPVYQLPYWTPCLAAVVKFNF